MVDLWQGLSQAFWLVVTLDAELAEIALRSLRVTLTALVLGSLERVMPWGGIIESCRPRWSVDAAAGAAACRQFTTVPSSGT